MEYDDRLTITTPEGVDLELMLAGVGSRFVSQVVDSSIQAVVIIALTIVAAVTGTIGAVVGVIGSFLVILGYDIFFEVFNSGRTPGKRWNGLRVLRASGRPIGFGASSVRNILRPVDYFLLLGVWSIVLTEKNQRLGDLAGATIVVRELHAPEAPPVVPRAPAAAAYAAWDTSAITAQELVAVQHFLSRRHDIDSHARNQLANTMAERLRPKVIGPPGDLRGERFLEALAAAKAARG